MLFDLENLQKFYGDFEALRGITLQVEEGSIGLLGPNGAGKSTLIKTLLGLLPFSRGSARILGMSLPQGAASIRQIVGYMPENDAYLPYMTAVQYVTFGGELSGMPRTAAFRRAHEVLHYVGLEEARYRKLAGFSTGMKQRVKLAQALVHGPRLVFLDEPTNGLDPKGRNEMLELVEDVKARGVNIILSSHLLADVERVCDSVIMMNQGALVHVGTIEALKQGGASVLDVRTKGRAEELAQALEERGFEVERRPNRLEVHVPEGDRGRAILVTARELGIQIRHFMPGELTLEAAFLGLIEGHRWGSEEGSE
ncbi:MAG: ABC transporter ATP-binding protein [Myxococcota bacterium]